MCSASQKCPPLSRRSTSRSRRNQMWCTVHKLATPQELVGLHGPQIHRTARGPHQSRLRSQRGIWLEVEVGPGYFVPPEDDSCSMDFTLEVLNHTYPGCTGVYLDRAICCPSIAGRAALKLASSRKFP